MRFNKLDLNNLVCLDALITERSVSRAADRLYLSRPAMSCALTRLREYFKDDLLFQVGKAMIPTPLALSLERPLRDVLLQLQAITSTSSVDVDLSKAKRVIKITGSDYVAAVFMPMVVARAFIEAPGIAFDFRAFSPRFVEELDSGDVDILIVSNTHATKNHPAEELFQDTFSCVTWTGNHEIGEALSLEQYLSLGHVDTQWGAGRLKAVDAKVFEEYGASRRTEAWVSTFSQVPMFLTGTNRLGTLQTRLAHLASKQWPIRVLPCPLPIPPLVEVLQWHKYQESDPVLNWIRTLMGTVAAEMSVIDTIKVSKTKEKRRAAS